ncbi:Uncharacterised protein [uncultured archaeon]|nr:Uncharacterised protein [uncultured archaeon]
MDKRTSDNKDLYTKSQGASSYDEYLEDGGKRYRVPYRTIKEVIFTGVGKDELRDAEHAARLQYRLLLLEPVLKAKVDFDGQKITILYNPETAPNRFAKMSLQGLLDFLAKEGVLLDSKESKSRDVDYYREVYCYQYDPKQIRERPPYSFTLEEWQKGMKGKYVAKIKAAESKKAEKFSEWKTDFEAQHPELK